MSKKTTINKKILEDLVREKLSDAKEADNLNFSTPPESDTEVITSRNPVFRKIKTCRISV